MEGDTATAREGGGGRVKGGVESSSEGESDMTDLIPEMEDMRCAYSGLLCHVKCHMKSHMICHLMCHTSTRECVTYVNEVSFICGMTRAYGT